MRREGGGQHPGIDENLAVNEHHRAASENLATTMMIRHIALVSFPLRHTFSSQPTAAKPPSTHAAAVAIQEPDRRAGGHAHPFHPHAHHGVQPGRRRLEQFERLCASGPAPMPCQSPTDQNLQVRKLYKYADFTRCSTRLANLRAGCWRTRPTKT